MRPYTVPPANVATATTHGLGYADHIAHHAGRLGIPYRYACALIEQESGGRNVWGNDVGGTFSGVSLEVTRGAYEVFYELVVVKGRTSNGVGPAQITWPGFLLDTKMRGVRLWRPRENIGYALERVLLPQLDLGSQNWWEAFHRYNGSGPAAERYADEVMLKAKRWRERFKEAREEGMSR